MALFGPTKDQPKIKPPTLGAQLTSTAGNLRAREEERSAASISFIAASQLARREAETAGVQADAVEQAARILEEAGVTL